MSKCRGIRIILMGYKFTLIDLNDYCSTVIVITKIWWSTNLNCDIMLILVGEI